uniref:nucleoporin p54-like isoform X2 n=1 Tax=Ciona intestinalis TaxID=7719 RepID=UPI00006A4618|nr:nucleoporin p54-like isoform X2 [Ciona intestinalis]|eukprot:XP_002127610.1 nucleoporin p54-like isoform X2 [Ciona intestinalis]
MAGKFTFGAPATTSASGGLFGSTASGSTGFSFGSKPAVSQTVSAFNFGSTTTSATTGFGTSTSGFGSGTSGFSGFGKPATTTTTASAFGTGFGLSKPTTSTGFGGLGGFNQTNQQPAAQPTQQDNAVNLLLTTATALSAPLVFGDERDAIMTKWNQIQAFWGTGRGFYRKDGAHVDFTPQNHFCRFKAVGYSCLPSAKDEDGLISLVCGKKEKEMQEVGKEKIREAIHKILGSNQSISVQIDSMREIPDNKTEITIYVNEQSSAIGSVRRVLASELHRFLQQTNIQQQLKQQLLVEACVPRMAMSEDKVRALLVNPPSGIDPVIWEQAKLDNPNTKNLIPVPMIGFSELRNRLRLQEMMAKQHQMRLDILSKGLHDVQQQQASTQSKVEQYKRKLLELSHRVLKVMINQEIIRKAGYAIQPEEEQLRVHLESMFNELNAPTQFRGRLNELLSQVRMHHPSYSSQPTSKLDPESMEEIRLHLRMQQEGISTLVKILQDDFKDLRTIESSLEEDDASSSHGYHSNHYPIYR